MLGFKKLLEWFNPKRLLMLLGGVVLAIALYFAVGFVDDKYALEQEVFEQTLVIQQRDASIETMGLQLAAARAATVAAEAALAAERDRAAEFTTARENVLNAAPADDGEVAPVLENALDAIRARRGTN
jgi:hypothetical protein